MFDLEKWKASFGYTDEWFHPGFLTRVFLEAQARNFQQGGEHDIEHFKWAAYRYILERNAFTSRDRFDQFICLVEADPNEHLDVK